MKREATSLLAALAALAAACSPAGGSQPNSRLEVVATFSVLGDLVQNVGRDQIDLHLLVGPGRDAHTFEPSPADNRLLAGASLVFENGLGFEPWLDDLYTSSGSQARRVAVTSRVEPLKAEAEAEGSREQGNFDPHVWHSVANVIGEVEVIRDALAQADPANAAVYQSNAQSYVAQLIELEAWIFDQVENVPPDSRKLLTTHDTFGYFARRYGFEILGSLLPSTTEGASPSAQEMAALVETVRAAGVPAVFAENVSSNVLLGQVADEAGVEVVASLYTDALGPSGSEAGTYLGMMRYNVATIVSELGQ